jgi:hypothetical protein
MKALIRFIARTALSKEQTIGVDRLSHTIML